MEEKIDEKESPLALILTPKEELAVIVQRLKTHEGNTSCIQAKIRLEMAGDLIRAAIIRFES